MSDSALLAETKSKNVWRKRAEDAEARAKALAAQLEAVTKDIKRALPALEQELKDVGGCDHSVGICVCDLRNAVELVAKHATGNGKP